MQTAESVARHCEADCSLFSIIFGYNAFLLAQEDYLRFEVSTAIIEQIK